MVSSELSLKTLSRLDSCLVVVDVQERLAPAIAHSSAVQETIKKLLRAAGELSVPCVFTEQYPKGLGPTLEPVRQSATDASVVSKMTFSAARETAFMERLEAVQCRQLLICGMETHVCVLQTALDLRARGYEVYLAADACGSRDPMQKELGLTRMRQEGIRLVTAEMVLFEWLERAGTEDFRSLLEMIK